MARRIATEKVVQTETLAPETMARKASTLAGSAPAPERHFVVPEFKVSRVKRNRSFVLGYN